MVSGMERTLGQRRSSCLLFQIIGVETRSFLPDGQSDRGNLSGQGEARHRWLPPLGQQSLVEIVQRSRTVTGVHGRTLEDCFEVVVVILIEPTKLRRFL